MQLAAVWWPCRPSGLLNNWPTTTDEVWIDIQAPHPNDFRPFLEQLNLHPLIMEDCLDPYRSSRFSSFEKSLHFEFSVFTGKAVDDYLSVVCIPRMLITIRTTQMPAFDGLLRDLESQMQLNAGTKSALLHAILNALGDRLIQAAIGCRDKIRSLSRSMDDNADAVVIDEVISVKRRLQDIATIAEDQLYCVRGLVAIDSDALSIADQRNFLRDEVRNYETALRVLHRHEARAAELQQQYTSCLQARTESRIRVLTILSAICMPLTLIAGIYGMNFAHA